MYHFFPGRQWENAPQWLISICIRSIPLIRAEQAKYDAFATRIAFSDKKGWEKGVRMLDRQAEPEKVKGQIILAIPANSAAANWFEQNEIPTAPTRQ